MVIYLNCTKPTQEEQEMRRITGKPQMRRARVHLELEVGGLCKVGSKT